MMRLVISPRHHHLVRQGQRGIHDPIITPNFSRRINCTSRLADISSWKVSSEQCPVIPSNNEHESTTHIIKSGLVRTKSCSPLPRQPHLLQSRAGRLELGHPKLLSSPASAVAMHSLARSRSGFQGRLSILNRTLHSSSSSNPLFSPRSADEQGKCSEYFHIAPQVLAAVKENLPVVALESAIITHGMPFPHNIDTAFRLESLITEHGVVPATVGVLHGRLTVGLTNEEIELLGSFAKPSSGNASGKSSPPVLKVSRRDLPFAFAHKLCGGTTVSGTIIAAVKAGIPIFATGGLGGVHRGAESTFDISADLKELGRSQIGVVSAGVKSILDIGKTLEYMETEGICVAVLEKSAESENDDEDHPPPKVGASGAVHEQIGSSKFPSFFTARSPFNAPYSVRSELEAASLLHAAFHFQLGSGVLIGVPIPKEHEGAGQLIEDAIKVALEKAGKNSIEGKDMTPFLLGEVNRLTGGESLKANKHLIENNVRAASKIATHLAQLRHQQRRSIHTTAASSREFQDHSRTSQTDERSTSPAEGESETLHNLQFLLFEASLGCGSHLGNHSIRGESSEKKNFHSISPERLSLPASGNRQGRRREYYYTGGGWSGVTHSPKTRIAVVCSSLTTTNTRSYSQFASRRKQRDGRPVVIGGTSLDLVLAIQEEEILVKP